MPILLLKLTLTPVLVGGASLAARRWGASIGGWIVSLPLTSAPVSDRRAGRRFHARDAGGRATADPPARNGPPGP